MVRIEHGVPIPPRSLGKSRKGKQRGRYPWAAMEVGDSFFARGATHISLASLASAWRYRNHMEQRKFSFRTLAGGVRVWRIK